MKKNFSLSSTKHKPDRQVELIKSDINKYLARERRKDVPVGVDFWDFDCKCGTTESSAANVHVSAIGKEIDKVFKEGAESVYVEILAKAGRRAKKVKPSRANEEDDEEYGY